MFPHSLDIAWHGKCKSGAHIHVYQGGFSGVSVHYPPLLLVSGGGAVGSMLGWPNGADPLPSHGWCQCQHIDFVCK